MAETASRKSGGTSVISEVDLLRINVERYRHMLQAETDENARQAIQRMLKEFEAKLRRQACCGKAGLSWRRQV